MFKDCSLFVGLGESTPIPWLETPPAGETHPVTAVARTTVPRARRARRAHRVGVDLCGDVQIVEEQLSLLATSTLACRTPRRTKGCQTFQPMESVVTGSYCSSYCY